ncbi:MAG: UDP-2,3-diacylglucosamine diphosphatase LpxI [Selenomonadaceae bacterium]|nr:UDP-2,3-diacylglucosamine diphosphatase LpxI [Selenomonadaceae bacterium]
MEKLGLLAGAGKLPVEYARAASQSGYEVCAVALLDQTDPAIADYAVDFQHISIAHVQSILDYLKDNDIHLVTMLGKVTKELLFNGKVMPDVKFLELIITLPDLKDDTIMMMFVRELEKIGCKTFDQTALIKRLMPPKGNISTREPTEDERLDMEFGFKIAKEIGRLDIGQTVVVKNRAVMAVEAIEGTDECILRGGRLANGGAVVIKVSKPQQDNRFDVPTVGLQTIEKMIEVGARALAIEADQTLLVERDKVIALADQHDIVVTAI